MAADPIGVASGRITIYVISTIVNQPHSSRVGYYSVPLACMRRSEKPTHQSCVVTVQFH